MNSEIGNIATNSKNKAKNTRMVFQVFIRELEKNSIHG